ncbi:aminoglycoside phosphotransferase family protein [Nocardiopsis sp. NPDC006832]|uniref:aminoglycoside phosphotransferase family protein n=1 Tax=Nocardiopsis sp. NPDC006832 TaxID=3157188 RepID=UPI0033FE5332
MSPEAGPTEDPSADEALVRSLLESQHPDLAEAELRLVDGGWDNRMWRLGSDLAVRMPRTARAPELLRKERRWLPSLAPELPLPVPVPVRAGASSPAFPHDWTITTWVPGEPVDRASLHDPRCARVLARFLSALHRPAPDDAPTSAQRGVPLSAVADGFEELLRRGAVDGDIDRVGQVWEGARVAPAWDGPPVWLHGDLHPANVVGAGGALTGVIDFGDMCAGDPATDLSAAWLLLPSGSAERFFAEYARADEATVLRARGWALLRCQGLIEIGRAGESGLPGGKPTWTRPALEALARVLD